jgi:hypothetical protein
MSPNATSLLALRKLREATQACIDSREDVLAAIPGGTIPGYPEASAEDRRWLVKYDAVLTYYAAGLIMGVEVPFVSLRRTLR